MELSEMKPSRSTSRNSHSSLHHSNQIIGAEKEDGESSRIGCCGWILTICSFLIILATIPLSLLFIIKVVEEHERAVIFRLGRLLSGGAKGPGIFFIMPCIETYIKVDLRTVYFEIPPQEVLTKDSVTVYVDAVVFYRVSKPTLFIVNVEDAQKSTLLLVQATLRNILGTNCMSEILSNRENINRDMKAVLDDATDQWGIIVERVEIKDVRLPIQLQRSMAVEAEAARDANAKVIAADGEKDASHAFKEAAEIIDECPTAMQLRYLQSLHSISAETNSTIIFPLPMDVLHCFLNKRNK